MSVCVQTALSCTESLFCVCDPSELTAGSRSVSTLGHQSGVRSARQPAAAAFTTVTSFEEV